LEIEKEGKACKKGEKREEGKYKMKEIGRNDKGTPLG
jgi:hypothetical protein